MTNFVLMGDVHSVFSQFEQALFFIQNNIPDYHLVMLGDVFDSRCSESNSVAIYHKIRELQDSGCATLLQSNHQWKLLRYLRGNSVKVDDSFQQTLNDFGTSDVTKDELLEWLSQLPFALSFRDANGLEYRCSHAYHSSRLYVPHSYDGMYRVQEVSPKMRDKLLYGALKADGQRLYWWENSSDQQWIRCAGHYHNVTISYDNHAIVLDSCCGNENGLLSIFDVNNRSLHQF